MKPPGATAVVLLAASATMGCSLLFTTGPEPEAPTAAIPPDCSTSRVPPVVDTALAGYSVVRTGLAIGAADSVYVDSPISREVDIGLGIGLTSLFALSAIHGFSATGACDRARRGWPDQRSARPVSAPVRRSW